MSGDILPSPFWARAGCLQHPPDIGGHPINVAQFCYSTNLSCPKGVLGTIHELLQPPGGLVHLPIGNGRPVCTAGAFPILCLTNEVTTAPRDNCPFTFPPLPPCPRCNASISTRNMSTNACLHYLQTLWFLYCLITVQNQ